MVMKYTNPRVIIPYSDGTELQYIALNFIGNVDKRRVDREVRKYCKKAFNKTVTKKFIHTECVICIVTVDEAAIKAHTTERLIAFEKWLKEEHEQTERDTEDKE